MDPAGEKPGYDPSGGAPPAYGQQQPPPQGYGAYPPAGAYPQGGMPPPAGAYPQGGMPPPAGAYPQGGMPPPQQQMHGQPPPQGQTVVVLSSPQVGPGVRDWVNGLCGCFNNCNVCILSWFCPCYVIGQNAEALGESFIVYAIAALFIPVLVQFFVRLKIRGRLNIVGSEVGDCCTVFCCQPCALAQERNEMLDGIEKGLITPNLVPQVILRQ